MRCTACNESLEDHPIDELAEFCNKCYKAYLDAVNE
jgi:hypothetical protein